MTNTITIYITPVRDIVVVKNALGNVYPFYRSIGVNSLYGATWFPWTGHFDLHPTFENQLYMVKPPVFSLSKEPSDLITSFLEHDALDFTTRMSSDECLAISCSLGGGIWEKKASLHEAIIQCETIKNNLQTFDIQRKVVKIPSREKDLVSFIREGRCSLVYKFHAIAAHKIAQIVEEERNKLSVPPNSSPNSRLRYFYHFGFYTYNVKNNYENDSENNEKLGRSL